MEQEESQESSLLVGEDGKMITDNAEKAELLHILYLSFHKRKKLPCGEQRVMQIKIGKELVR